MSYDRSDMEKARDYPCPDCGAKPGEDCVEPGVPGPRQDGTHASRLRQRPPAIEYSMERVKPLAELRPSDVPHGVDPDDLATDL